MTQVELRARTGDLRRSVDQGVRAGSEHVSVLHLTACRVEVGCSHYASGSERGIQGHEVGPTGRHHEVPTPCTFRAAVVFLGLESRVGRTLMRCLERSSSGRASDSRGGEEADDRDDCYQSSELRCMILHAIKVTGFLPSDKVSTSLRLIGVQGS